MADAMTALGIPLQDQVPGAMTPGNASLPATGECTYETAPTTSWPSGVGVRYECGISVELPAIDADFSTEIAQGESVAVTGLGDEAIWQATGTDSSTLSGGVLSVISGNAELIVTVFITQGGSAQAKREAISLGHALLPRLF
jgi:hypothetical protein